MMEKAFIFLLNNSIAAGYLVLAVLILRPLLAKAPKFIRCILWGLVGLRLVLPFSIESVLSLIPSAEPVPQEILYSPSPAVHTGIYVLNSAVNPVISTTMAPTPGDSVNPMQIGGTVASYIWIAGVVIMALYGLISYLRLRKKLREAVSEGENIWVCDQVSSPFLLGIFRPRIYLPSGLSQEDRVYVLAHEKAHLGRKDHWWKPLGFLLLTVYWFNPLMWVAYIFLCRDIEFACDEKVIRQLGNDCKIAYSNALINCSLPRKMISACPVAFGEGGVKKRIKSVLNYKKPAFWIVIIALILCIVVAVCFLTDPPEEDAPDTTAPITYSFKATVLELQEASLLVRPMEGEAEYKTSDKFVVKLPDGNTEDFAVGDWVEITYDGMIQELYPAIIPNVISVANISFLSSYIGNAPTLPDHNTDLDGYYIPQEYDTMKTYPLLIYAYQLGDGAWYYAFYQDATIVGTVKDASTGATLGMNQDAAKQALTKYDIAHDEIPVIVTTHMLSSYYYEITDALVLEARTVLGLEN